MNDMTKLTEEQEAVAMDLANRIKATDASADQVAGSFACRMGRVISIDANMTRDEAIDALCRAYVEAICASTDD